MFRQFTNISFLAICTLLVACAGGPVDDGATVTATAPVDVEPQARNEYQKALNALRAGDEDTAIRHLTGMTRKYPNLAGAFVNLGMIYLKKGRYEDARQALEQATTIKPGDAVAQTHLGIAYRHLGEFDKAAQSYQQALSANPKYANAYLNAGILYDIYLQELNKALQYYEQYKALSGDSDNLVEKWIIDLKRRIGNNNQAKVAP